MCDTAEIETQGAIQGVVLQYRVHTPNRLQYFELSLFYRLHFHIFHNIFYILLTVHHVIDYW